jgi:lambda family phage minor tail protein L
MKSISSGFKSGKNSLTKRPTWLYIVENYDGNGTNLNLAEKDKDIIYSGITYQAAPMRHEEIGENSAGEVDTIRISVSNVNRIMEARLWLYDLRGKKVTIRLVWADRLNDPDAHLDFVYYIDTYTSNETTVEFTLAPKFDLLDIELPLERYSRNYCRYRDFKGEECGYTGAETTCDRRKSTCKNIMNNVARFGGQPGTPSGRIYV